MSNRQEPKLWTILASYYRRDYNFSRAAGAVSRALALAPKDANAILEQARIKKADGRIKDYQNNLRQILETLKSDYRA